MRIENLSDSDPLVILKHFGPGQSRRRAVDSSDCGRSQFRRRTDFRPSTGFETDSHIAQVAGHPQRDVAGARRQRARLRAADRSRYDARSHGRRGGRTASKFDGVDLFLFDPHVSIDSTDDDLRRLRDKIACATASSSARWSRRCGRPPAAAPRWASADDRTKFVTQVRKACAIGKKLRDLGIRTYGVVRIDSASSPAEWATDPAGQHEEDRRDLPRGVRGGRGLRRDGLPPKARSAGAACTAGSG